MMRDGENALRRPQVFGVFLRATADCRANWNRNEINFDN